MIYIIEEESLKLSYLCRRNFLILILMAAQTLKFVKADAERAKFFVTLKQRVDGYFKENNISKTANWDMKLKTVAMLAMYFVPYGFLMTGVFPLWAAFALFTVMGLGLAGVGMSVMHDANHGAYSDNPIINKIVGYSLNLMGACAFTWKIQHNIFHHTYTNIADHDEDIRTHGIFRFTEADEWRKRYRFQTWYALPLYSLMTLSWMVDKDLQQLIRYKRTGMVDKVNGNMKQEVGILLATKGFYALYILILPLLLSPVSWWAWLIGLAIMHVVAGVILSVVFQLAHVLEETEFPTPTDEGIVENQWAVHQLETTADFAQRNRILNWYVGGLNFQVEHHLFPNICHVHYPAIAKIVKQTAVEFDVTYNSHDTFWLALKSHFSHLHKLGQEPVAAKSPSLEMA